MIASGLPSVVSAAKELRRRRHRHGQQHRTSIIGWVNEYPKRKCALCRVEFVGHYSQHPCVTDLEVSPAAFQGSGLEVSP